MKSATFLFRTSFFIALVVSSSCQKKELFNAIHFDVATSQLLDKYIESIHVDSLAGIQPQFTIENVSDNLVRIGIRYQLTDSIHQDDWKVTVHPAFNPRFHWAPHLTPTDQNII